MPRLPMISVIVPVYKAEGCLDRCVRSVLAQSFTDFELILVEDGSPDRCGELCDKWAEKDVRVRVIHQKNGGPSAARNAGIRASRGRYVTFVDSDDLISPSMLGDLLSLLEENGADISVCGLFKARSEGELPPGGKAEVTVHTRDGFMDVMLKINSNRTVHYVCGKLYKREVLDDSHFPVTVMNGEDVEGTFKAVMRSQRIAETTAQEYHYFINPQSITHGSFGKNFLSLRDVWKRVLAISRRHAPQYEDKVRFNLMRMDFTVLTESILRGTRETDRLYGRELMLCRKRLRKNIDKLMRGPMVAKRKTAALAVCFFYTPIRACFRLKTG